MKGPIIDELTDVRQHIGHLRDALAAAYTKQEDLESELEKARQTIKHQTDIIFGLRRSVGQLQYQAKRQRWRGL
jgi:cell division septum initiation protein DivIVA